MTTIRWETPADQRAIAAVVRAAFGRADEARLVAMLRDGQYARLSLVAEEHGAIVGHVMYSELAIVRDPETVWALSLAPLAVGPKYQRRGIGQALIEATRQEAPQAKIVLLSAPMAVSYYPHIGFYRHDSAWVLDASDHLREESSRAHFDRTGC